MIHVSGRFFEVDESFAGNQQMPVWLEDQFPEFKFEVGWLEKKLKGRLNHIAVKPILSHEDGLDWMV